MALERGQSILNGKYIIQELLGEGGMARVWLAKDQFMEGREVAVKEPRSALSLEELEDLWQRFQREVLVARVLSEANVPNVVPVYTVEQLDENTRLLVMQYMRGSDLRALLKARPKGISLEQSVQILMDVCRGLAVVHQEPVGIVHRDIKPGNILFDEKGTAHLADFGLAQLRDDPDVVEGGHPGTAMYMAPEQARSPEKLTPAADVYALGGVLFEMLTGKRYKKVRPGTPPSKLRPDVPPWLDDVTLIALHEDPQQRWRDAGQLLQALQEGMANQSITVIPGADLASGAYRPLQQGTNVLKGAYEIQNLLAESELLRVWVATSRQNGQQRVVVKEPKAESEEVDVSHYRERFEHGREILGRLEQAGVPNIVPILALDERMGNPLQIQAFMPGGNLADHIKERRGTIPVDEAITIATDVLRALDAIHALGIVHRNIKPTNILFDEQGAACLADFGLAQVDSEEERQKVREAGHPGTPDYMAPEQTKGKKLLTPQADIYALGAVLFEVLTGKKYKRVRPGTRPSQFRQDIPNWVDELIQRAVARKPTERWPSARDMLQAIENGLAFGTLEPEPETEPQPEPVEVEPASSPLPSAPEPQPSRPAAETWESYFAPEEDARSRSVISPTSGTVSLWERLLSILGTVLALMGQGFKVTGLALWQGLGITTTILWKGLKRLGAFLAEWGPIVLKWVAVAIAKVVRGVGVGIWTLLSGTLALLTYLASRSWGRWVLASGGAMLVLAYFFLPWRDVWDDTVRNIRESQGFAIIASLVHGEELPQTTPSHTRTTCLFCTKASSSISTRKSEQGQSTPRPTPVPTRQRPPTRTSSPRPITPSSRSAPKHFWVTAYRLNVRAGPGISYQVIGKLNRGERVTVIGYNDAHTWAQISAPYSGWVSTKYITSRRPETRTRCIRGRLIRFEPQKNPLNEIWGRVLNGNGTPIQGWTLEVTVPGYEHAFRARAVTQKDGSFYWAGLTPQNEYAVRIVGTPYRLLAPVKFRYEHDYQRAVLEFRVIPCP